MLDRLKSVSSFRVGASCFPPSFLYTNLKSTFHIFSYLSHPTSCIHDIQAFQPFCCLLQKSYLTTIFQYPRYVLQPRKYVVKATARSRACQLISLRLKVLTSREGGVATVWYLLTLPIQPESHHQADIDRLVATLGSRSNSKKINRKAILDVDVPKTCSIIIQPEAPMALRLQSNLL